MTDHRKRAPTTLCAGCSAPARDRLCSRCRATLSAATERVAMGVLVRAAFDHTGVARDLVHRLKYEGSAVVADVLAASMAPLLPDGARALIPVPRVLARRWRYGVDPAVELASAVARRAGIGLLRALRPMLWTPRRAGPAAAARGMPRFSLSASLPAGSVLVDDVVTTGTTLAAAAEATGVRLAVTATSALRP